MTNTGPVVAANSKMPIDPESSLDSHDARCDECAIRAGLLRALYRQFVLVLLANVVVAGVTAAVVWPYIEQTIVIAWLCAIMLLSGIRLYFYGIYRRGPDSDESAQRWARAFTIGATASGVLWGFAAYAFFVPDSLIVQVFIAFVIAGLTAGATGAHSAHMPAFLGLAIPSLLPLAVRLTEINEPTHFALALLVLFYFVMLTMLGRIHRGTLEGALRLEAEKSRLLEQLRDAHKAAEAASHAKSAFLANMSHELRTPLNAVNGFSQIMMEQLFGPIGNERYRQYAGLIHKSGSHLLQLIEDILDLSKIESGSVELKEGEFDPRTAIAVGTDLLRDRAEEAGVELRCAVAAYMPMLHGDERRFRQIVINLVSNAVKFTPRGGEVAVAARIAGDGQFVLTVADTGVGIAEDELQRVMAPFVQGSEATRRNLDGAGLGLPLVKLLVDLHGGRMQVSSATGSGTTVEICLPANRVLNEVERLDAVGT